MFYNGFNKYTLPAIFEKVHNRLNVQPPPSGIREQTEHINDKECRARQVLGAAMGF